MEKSLHMTHRHDIDERVRLELSSKNSGVGAISPPWLRDVIRNRYPDPHTNGNLHTLAVYHPTAVTDDVEAAIFAAAWKLNGWSLRKKFGDDDTVSLFQRFGPYGLIKSGHTADRMITVDLLP
ncbi:hypothetical protein PXK05_19970 [Phaeobacter gallaeciensis]|uniref:hypothetical protein n=1 Tax=Phaeobacter gallaeciensis TaxID=60890 RepID=UPI00237EF9D6|nr:hypothetical protein [Phaeobacter gallaeciensis]MDE4155339.1 hypothetical protein [Phaeobacter gallaeciensis]MDE4230729.1 hypothetical protein [Phaeobacter gallaeciensis]MDE4259806.1 hypothetical protein [Phaeobacter gallaeciensis]MDE4268162.1 hypothetical protein [Phaeobacter gallaeciensis]